MQTAKPLLLCFPHSQKKNIITRARVLRVSAGAEILPVESVYFLNFMVLLEIQMSSKMHVETAAPLASTRGDTAAPHGRPIKALIVTRRQKRRSQERSNWSYQKPGIK